MMVYTPSATAKAVSLAAELKAERAVLATSKLLVACLARELKTQKQLAKTEKQHALVHRRNVAIGKAQDKLQKLLDKQNPVGAKANKANRKPSKAVSVTL